MTSSVVGTLRRWAALAENRRRGAVQVDYVCLRDAAAEIERLQAERTRILDGIHTAHINCPHCGGVCVVPRAANAAERGE